VEKVAIVGTGPAGLTAAVYAARAGLEPVVVDGMQPGGQLTTTTEVENYPGFPESIDGTALVQNMRDQAARFGTRYINGEITESDFSGSPLKLMLSDGSVIESLSIIIATGASAKYLGIESEQKLMGRGVSACATCDGAFYRGQNVAVVGGGDTAIEEAIFLTRMVAGVTVIHRRDELRASKILADRALANDKITFEWNSVVEEVLDVEKNEVTGLKLKNVKTGEVSRIDVTGVFMAIGHHPNTEAYEGQLELEDGFIKAENTRTSVAGVFAAGDVQDPDYKQAVTAAGSGCMAALEAERYLSSLNA
jgi:thioredoxin reductase (NADPH)